MKIETLRNIRIFLQRVQLSGQEALAFIQMINEIEAEIVKQEQESKKDVAKKEK